MKFDFDDIGFKDQIELMNLQRKMQNEQFNTNQTIGLNSDTIYNYVENNENTNRLGKFFKK